jgi:hypothetical protein
MICPELSQMPSPEPDSPQVEDIRLEFTIESLTFPGLAGLYNGTAIIPDGEDVELEDQRAMEGLLGSALFCALASSRRIYFSLPLQWTGPAPSGILIRTASHMR